MEKDEKQKSLDQMLRDAAIEKYGLGGIVKDVETVKSLLLQVKSGKEVIKGEDGKTPVLGVDYLNEEEQQAALELVRPKKGVDYNDGAPGEPGKDGYTPVRGIDYLSDNEMADIVTRVTPKKGADYFTPEEVVSFKKEVTPIKGIDYKDGANPTAEQFIEVIKGLKGQEATSFSQAVGAKIDISHVRNASSFMFNGKKYDTSELMHGGGSGGGGTGTVTSVATGAGLTGGPITTTGTIALDSKLAPLDTLGTAGQLIRVNAGATALEYFTAAAGGVDTVVGTANRITVDSTDPANPIIDIAATYVGQTSITTLGTVATGTWSATTIALNKGGTGQTTKAAAFDALSPMTTGGDIIYGGASGTGTRLANGSAGQVLTSSGTTVAPTWQTPTTGTVTSVSGTTNRITSTGGAAPVIDISASYVGQSSITTLGTVTTGTWSATTIAVAKGGTGVTTIAAKSIWLANSADTITSVTPGAGQSIRINAGNTAWEAYTPTAGTVTSVSGTANRISSTGGATPVIDIDAAYVGQTSITTLGTVATGTWSATTIAVNKGGTGQTTYTDGQLLIGNSTGNTLAKSTLTAGTGISVTNGSGAITISVDATVGYVVGPASATDNAIARFDGTTGKLIQNSALIIDDTTGNITGPAAGFKITGGTGTTADLSLQTTSGVGAAGGDMHFLVGNAGATEAMTILNSGFVGIGTNAPSTSLQVKPALGGSFIVGNYASADYAGISLNGGAIADATFNFLSSISDQNLYINRPTGFDISFRQANVVQAHLTTGGNFSVGSGVTTPTFKLEVDGSIGPHANDGGALGSTSLNFSDIFLATGALINWNNGNAVLTHSSGILTVSTGDLRVTTTGTNAASVPTLTSTNTLTNKRITRRLTTTNAPGATPSTNTDNVDVMNYTGLATAITSMTTNLTGTPVDGDLLEYRFLDDGTARGITWGASFAATTVALPTTTVISTCLRVGFEWRAASSKWECVATC